MYNFILDKLKSSLKLLPGGSTTRIGLDIGADSIKFVKLKKKGGTNKLLSYGIVSVSRSKGKPSEEETLAISKSLRKLLKDKNGVPIFTAVSGSDVIIKNFNLAQISGTKFGDAVFWASKKYVPVPLEETYFDYQVIGEIEERKIKKKEVLVVVAAKRLINNLLDLFSKSRFKIEGITVTPFALWNLLKVAKTDYSNIGLIDIGAQSTTIAIFHKNILKFTREIITSGNRITESIASLTSVSFEEAEKLKKECGLSKESPRQEVVSAITSVVERLINEIQRSFSFYKQRHPEHFIEKIYLTGGSARLKGLPEIMKKKLNTDIEIINSLEKIETESCSMDSAKLCELAPVFTKAVGLALESNGGIDLLPSEIKHQKLIARFFPVLRVSVLFFFLFSLILYLDVTTRVNKNLELLGFWKSNIQNLTNAALTPEQIREKVDRYKKMKEVVNKLEKREIIDPCILKEISNIVPESIVLKGLSIVCYEGSEKQETGSKVECLKIEGIVCGKEFDLEVDLLRFLITLDSSPFLKNPTVLSEERGVLGEKNVLNFEVVCDLK